LSRHWWLWLVLGALASSTGCGRSQAQEIDTLLQVPGALVEYPGADLYGDNQHQQRGPIAWSGLDLTRFVCTTAMPGDVHDYFDTSLTGLGWRRATTAVTPDPTSYTQRWTWDLTDRTGTNRRYTLSLATASYADRVAALVHKPTGCRTPFETTLR